MAGLTVVFAGIALSGAPLQVATLVLAAGLAGYGLLQRLRGADACAPRPVGPGGWRRTGYAWVIETRLSPMTPATMRPSESALTQPIDSPRKT